MDTDTKQLIGQRVQFLRKHRKQSQEILAERVGIDAKSLSRLERGAHYPSIETLERLAQALEVELKDFFDFTGELSVEQMRNLVLRTAHEADPHCLKQLVHVIEAWFREHKF